MNGTTYRSQDSRAGIAGPLGGIALAGALVHLFYLNYRAGRRQGS